MFFTMYDVPSVLTEYEAVGGALHRMRMKFGKLVKSLSS